MGRRAFEGLTETMFYVLMAFLRAERCGTEVVEFIRHKTRDRLTLGPGTLYTILAKFEEEQLIREVNVLGRKRTYRLTDKGRALYGDELERLRACIADAESEEEDET